MPSSLDFPVLSLKVSFCPSSHSGSNGDETSESDDGQAHYRESYRRSIEIEIWNVLALNDQAAWDLDIYYG